MPWKEHRGAFGIPIIFHCVLVTQVWQLHEILPNYVQSAFGKYKCHTLVKYIEQSE